MKLRQNGFAVALTVGLVAALVLGAVYALASRNRTLAEQAAGLHTTHQLIQSATVARGQLELAAYQASLRSEGLVIDEAALDLATERAAAALAAAGQSHAALAALGEATRTTGDATGHLVNNGLLLIDEIDGGSDFTTVAIDAEYQRLIGELTGIRDRLSGEVAAAERSGALAGSIGGFLAVFAIPALVIGGYFWLDRRRRRQHQLEVSLQAESAAHEARERFLTTVSHQLREPLWAVRGLARMLGHDEALMAQPQMADMHLLLAGELDDMNGLMDNLLTASRLEGDGLDYSIEPVDVREAARNVVEALDDRGASIYIAMDDGTVAADRRYLRQVLRNLVANALKFGGPNIEVKGKIDADGYTLTVVDDGQGVPEAVEQNLFTRFVHDDRDVESIGLGLSVVMALAIGMGGTAFHNREDGLTTFGVVLPVVSSTTRRDPTYESPSTSPANEPSG